MSWRIAVTWTLSDKPRAVRHVYTFPKWTVPFVEFGNAAYLIARAMRRKKVFVRRIVITPN